MPGARRRRILCVDAGVPGYDDADAWAYGLHGMLREAGFDTLLVHLLTEADVWFFRHFLGNDFDNPSRLDGVRRCIIEEPLAERQAARTPHPDLPPQGGKGPSKLADLIDAFPPELLVAWGTTAARLLKCAAPQLPLVLMVGQCAGLEELIDVGAVRDFLAFRAGVERGVLYPFVNDDPDLDAFAACDLAVSPSALAGFTHRHFCRAHAGKMYGRPLAPAALATREAECFTALRRPFPQRDIDVLFIAARWDVPARNLRLAAALCAGLRSRSVHLVGECTAALPTHTHTHGIVPRRALYELLGRSKVAVFPGLADAAPGGMFEASAMGCNVVASPGCGFWELCHDDLLVPMPSAAAFLDRIELACSQPFGDHRDQFLGDTAELIETLAVF